MKIIEVTGSLGLYRVPLDHQDLDFECKTYNDYINFIGSRWHHKYLGISVWEKSVAVNSTGLSK